METSTSYLTAQIYNDAVTFAKRKHHFADTNSDAQLIDLLQEIRKEVSLKHTGIKQEPYSAPVQDTHTNHLQQNISQLQTDIQSLKEAINTPHTQYTAPLDTNPVALQQQLSKIKEDINHLQQMKQPNAYPTLPGNYRSFRTTDGLLHVHAKQTYHLQDHPRVTRITNTTMYFPPPRNIHGRRTLPIAPLLITILNVLPMDRMSIKTTQWDILTHKTQYTLISRGTPHSHLPIKSTTSIKRKGFQIFINSM